MDNRRGLRLGYPASEPITVPAFTGTVFEKALEANTNRLYLDIQNEDSTNDLRFFFVNDPFALSFDGGDHIDIDTVLGELLTADRGDMELFILNPTAFTQDNTLISFGDTNADEHMRLFIDNADSDKLKAELIDGGVVKWRLETDVGLDLIGSSLTFFSVKLLQQRSAGGQQAIEPTIFVNGEKVPQTFTTSTDKTAWLNDISANVDNARLGSLNADSAGEADQMEGKIDHVRIRTISGLTDFTLVAEYEIDEGTGLTIPDLSDNGNTGTLGTSTAKPTLESRSAGRVMAADTGREFVDNQCPRTAVWLNSSAGSGHGTITIREG